MNASLARLRRLWEEAEPYRDVGTAWRDCWRGALLSAVIAMAASFVARTQGGPQLLYALFFGIAFHFLANDPRIRPGVEFCTRTVLHLGVALLGARITVTQIAALGWQTAAIVAVAVASTIVVGVWLARRLGMNAMQGVLSGGATAICGASAALAIAAVLPRTREQERFTLLVVVCVTSFSTLAMLIYPLIASALGLPPALAGLFLGATIHDVAQVVGAGYTMSPAIGDAATLVKLLRISLLAFVVVAIAASFRSRPSPATRPNEHKRLVPWFLQLFLLLVVLHSLQVIPTMMQPILDSSARACLVVAIAALGVKTSFQTLLESGWRPFALLAFETLWLAAFVLAACVSMRPA